jgi:hypothetical protein
LLTREPQDKIDLKVFAVDAKTAISISVHLLRVSILRWVLVPVLMVPVLTCLCLIVADAIGLIKPMRGALLTAVATITGGGVVTSAISAAFGWLYKPDTNIK